MKATLESQYFKKCCPSFKQVHRKTYKTVRADASFGQNKNLYIDMKQNFDKNY